MARQTVCLPYDVLCVVANFITTHKDLLSFCLASRDCRDAGIPFLYRDIFYESWPDPRPDESIPSGDWYRVSDPAEGLFSILYKDLLRSTARQRTARHVRTIRHYTILEGDQKENHRTQDMPKNQLVYLVEMLPQLQDLQISVDDLTIDALEDAISTSPTLKSLSLTGHRILSHSCQSIRLAQDTLNFLPLWGNICNPNLRSLTLTELQPSCRIYLDRYSIPGSVEIWQILKHCPGLKRLDIRVRLTARDNRNNYVNDFAGRSRAMVGNMNSELAGVGVGTQPIVHLSSLRLQNCTLPSFEFNRLDPSTMEELHIPYNGRKRLFRDLGPVTQFTAGPGGVTPANSMVFPINLKSLVVDSLPLAPDRKEPWQEAFDKCFAMLKLDELIVLTRKADFWVQSTSHSVGGASSIWVSRSGDDLSPNTRNVAVGMITGERWPGERSENSRTAPSTIVDDNEAGLENLPNLGSDGGIPISLGMGSWLKRLLLKGSWTMTRTLLDSLLSTCWGLEELGVALLWRDWKHDKSLVAPSIKRLRHLRTLIILNEPNSSNINPEWGSPLPTKNKVWGNKLDINQTFLQYGQPQERLRWFGIGKKMWGVVLEEGSDEQDEISGRSFRGSRSRNTATASSSRARTAEVEKKRWKRVLREVDRETVDGVKILDWIRFCDECWINDVSDKTAG